MSELAGHLLESVGSVFPWLLAVAAAGTLVLLAAMVWVVAGRRLSAHARVSVWRTTAASLVALPLLVGVAWTGHLPALGLDGRSLPLGFTDFVVENAPIIDETGPGVGEYGEAAALGTSMRGNQGVDAVADAASAEPVNGGSSARSDSQSGPSAVSPLFAGAAVALWVLGALLLSTRLIGGLLVLRHHGRRASPVESELLDAVIEHLTGSGRTGMLRVVRGGPFSVPVCWGIFQPTILLPWDSDRWTEERMHAVLHHEIAHLQRRDAFYLAMGHLALAVHWWNPLAWILRKRLATDTEEVCDAMVLQAGIPARRYARVLVDTARDARRHGRRAVLAAMGQSGPLASRIERILEGAPATERPMAGTVGVGVVLLMSVLAPLAAAPVDRSSPEPSVGPVLQADTVAREEIVDGLVQALEDPASDVRRSAVNSLRDIADPRGLEALRRVLDDVDENVRLAAETALGQRPARPNMTLPPATQSRLPSETEIDSLQRHLGDPDVRSRLRAVRALGNFEDPRWVPALVDRLVDVDFRIRGAAAAALGNVGDPAAVSDLASRLHDPHPHVRARAAAALGNIGDPRALAHLVEAWPDADDDVRANLVSAVGALGDRSGAHVPLEGLRDDSNHVRRVAAEALGKLAGPASPEARPAETAPLRDAVQPVPETRRASGTIQPPPATCEVRPTAIDLSLAAAITTLLENPDAESRRRAAAAIGVLASPQMGSPPGESSSPATSEQKDHHHALIVGLSDPAPEVRVAAACSLARSGDGRALEYLTLRSRSSEPESLREAVRWAIDRIQARSTDGES